ADQCLPAEEGTPHNISCVFDVSRIGPNFQLPWTAVINETYHSTVATCYFGRCEASPGFKARVVSNKSILTIDNVSRTDPFSVSTTWRCDVNRTVCGPLQVYSTPTNVKCEFPPFNTSSDRMPIVCTTDRIYPYASYQTFISTDKATFRPVSKIYPCKNSPRNETPVYYTAECTLSVQLQNFRTGDNYIKVKIFPDVSNGDQAAGVYSDVYQVTLSLSQGDGTSEVSTRQYLIIGLGIGVFVAACAAVFLGVSTFIYRRKCQSFELRPRSQYTKQTSKDIPVGYNAINKLSIDEDNSGEMYEAVIPPATPSRPSVLPKPILMESIYGNAQS
ncbi:unnamed protein product, partial [Candidula unifasciata]